MKDDSVYLNDMLDMAHKISEFIAGKNRADFDSDEILRIALTHLLQTIGEAARRISSVTRDAHPEIPWKLITGMRHRVVHDYSHIDVETVWDTIQKDIPVLIAQLEAIITDLGSAEK
jgi:uncharacterized protein with HEPN domain